MYSLQIHSVQSSQQTLSIVGIFVVRAAAYSAVMNLGGFDYEEGIKDKVSRKMTGMIAEESAAYSAVLWESRGGLPLSGKSGIPLLRAPPSSLKKDPLWMYFEYKPPFCIFCLCLQYIKI